MRTKIIKLALSDSKRLRTVILSAALLLGIVGYCIYGNIPVEGDALLHKRLGIQVADGSWVQSYDFGFVRTPGYPLILGVVYYSLGVNDQYVKILQIVIFSITAALIFSLGDRVFGKFVGFMSAVWFMTYYDFIMFSCLLMREIWVIFSLVLTMIFMVLFVEKRRCVYVILSSMSFAYLVLIDPRYIFFVIALAGFVLVSSKGAMTKVSNFCLTIMGILLFLIPWSIRQTNCYESFVVFTPQTDKDIYGVLHAPSESKVKSSIYFADSLTREDYLEALAETGLSDSKKSTLEKQLTDDYIRRMQTKIPKVKIDVWLHRVREYWRSARFNIGVRTGSDQRLEYPWGTAKNINNIIHVGVLLPFMFFGLYTILKQKRPTHLLLVSFFLYHLMFHVFVQYLYRYRYPVLPFLFLIGWYGVVSIAGALNRK